MMKFFRRKSKTDQALELLDDSMSESRAARAAIRRTTEELKTFAKADDELRAALSHPVKAQQ